MIEQKVLEAYTDGSTLNLISESFNITIEEIENILINYKEKSKLNKSFTDEFKQMIAERDLNGVARSTIAKELKLNVNTIKKACELFGQAIKDKAPSDLAFTRIDGQFTMDTCPNCKSSRVNEVDDKTIYCKDCGNEFFEDDGVVYKVNWEYIE